jgi:hypothetical protein
MCLSNAPSIFKSYEGDRTRDPTGKVAECVGMRGRRANPRSAPGRRGRSVGRGKWRRRKESPGSLKEAGNN